MSRGWSAAETKLQGWKARTSEKKSNLAAQGWKRNSPKKRAAKKISINKESANTALSSHLTIPSQMTQDGPFAVASLPVEALAAPSVQDASSKEMHGATQVALGLDSEETECCADVGMFMGTKRSLRSKSPLLSAPGIFL
jgi:hypothetical protein